VPQFGQGFLQPQGREITAKPQRLQVGRTGGQPVRRPDRVEELMGRGAAGLEASGMVSSQAL